MTFKYKNQQLWITSIGKNPQEVYLKIPVTMEFYLSYISKIPLNEYPKICLHFLENTVVNSLPAVNACKLSDYIIIYNTLKGFSTVWWRRGMHLNEAHQQPDNLGVRINCSHGSCLFSLTFALVKFLGKRWPGGWLPRKILPLHPLSGKRDERPEAHSLRRLYFAANRCLRVPAPSPLNKCQCRAIKQSKLLPSAREK